MQDVATWIGGFLSPNTILYAVLYFLLTVGFTYFYTAFTFNPDETAEWHQSLDSLVSHSVLLTCRQR